MQQFLLLCFTLSLSLSRQNVRVLENSNKYNPRTSQLKYQLEQSGIFLNQDHMLILQSLTLYIIYYELIIITIKETLLYIILNKYIAICKF